MAIAEQRLQRALGPVSAGAFVVSNMVGAGIFLVPAFARATTGSAPAALAVWAAGGVLALCGALCYAELSVRMPRAGAEYHYLARVYGPLWGFLSGWVSLIVGFSGAMAASSLGAVAYFAELIDWDASVPLVGGVTRGSAAAAALVLVLALYHSMGVRESGYLQTFLATLGIGAIVVLVTAGFATGRGEWQGVFAGEWTGIRSWWVALIQVSFAYSGWNAAAYLAGEVDRPERNLPRALLGGTLVVTSAYLALNVLFFYALPAAGWEADIAVGHAAAETLFGPWGSRAVTAMIALAMFGSVSAMTAAGPRVYYAMSRDGLGIPGLERLTGRGVPAVAIVTQGVWAAILALTGAFAALFTYIGSALLVFTGLAVAAVFKLRRADRGAGSAGAEGRFRVPGYPVTPALYLVVVVFALGSGLLERPGPTGAAAATIAAGAAIFFVGRRQGWLSPGIEDG